MKAEKTKRAPGRPKTLDKAHVLEVAMMAYWTDGADGVSITEICKRAEVSKPGLYREFGNEDGLMKAVLSAYQQQMLRPVYEMIATDEPFRETLDKLVSLVTTTSDDENAPRGCLLVKMRESYRHVGEVTQKQIDHAKEQALTAYESWVERAKERGEFLAEMPTAFVASYIDAQVNNALSLISRGEPNDTVKKMLITAFSMLG